LPFACLLTAPATPGRPVPYLIHTHQVSYGWSASLLFRQARRGAPRGKRLLVMAPRFDSAPPGEPQFAGVRAEFGPLAHNEAEARAVHDLFGGNLFLGEEATEARFKALAPRYAYIHLSTHAKTYDESPLLSCLAFTAMAGDTTEDHRLQVAELYQLSLNAELVVLSACETGVGQLRRGEGIFGLARAFSYAGAQSLAATLWKVDDAAAAELMRAFYAYLKKGLPKDEALRQAQLDYLEQADPLHAHPFFWAGYTLFGRIDALETSSPINSGPIAAGLGLALVIVGAAWVWMRRARRSSPRL
jgi:CHAT domain-containing protein